MLKPAELNWWGEEAGLVSQGPRVAGECLEEKRRFEEASA